MKVKRLLFSTGIHWFKAVETQLLLFALQVDLLFDLRDIWIGIYWCSFNYPTGKTSAVWIYLCVIPMLPLRIRIDLAPDYN